MVMLSEMRLIFHQIEQLPVHLFTLLNEHDGGRSAAQSRDHNHTSRQDDVCLRIDRYDRHRVPGIRQCADARDDDKIEQCEEHRISRLQ